MSGVEPVAKHRLPEKLTLTVRRGPSSEDTGQTPTPFRRLSASVSKMRNHALVKTTALALFGSLIAFSQPSSTGHLDAAHLLGLDGPGAERWQTFLMASPAGSIHDATLHLDDERGADLAHAGVGQLSGNGVQRAAIASLESDDDLITGSIPDGRDPLVARDTRANRMMTPAVHALLESRRTPVSLFEQHPFAQLEIASLPTDGFGGYIGMIAPNPDVMVAAIDETQDGAAAFDEFGTPGENIASDYAMAMVDPSAAASALAATEGQRQISAFLTNDRQFQCLAEGVYFEARGEPRRGQVAVAQVIMNRVNHDEFPDTICGVVYQNQHWRNRCQFSFACDGVPERITERAAWEMAEDVSRQVLENRDLIETIEESTHYHATYVRPRWAPRMIRLDRVGLHIFYKGRYGGWR
ncbi:MAG: cell wall hydrolase [Hyphomicrobiales bacterium]|jgi:spore germination cell wall hydrolase CwlJ-like protein